MRHVTSRHVTSRHVTSRYVTLRYVTFVCIIPTCGKVNKFKWWSKGCSARKIVISKIYIHDMQVTTNLLWERVTHAGTFKLLDAYRITWENLLCRLLISSCIKICLYEAGENHYGYPSNSATRKTLFMKEGNSSSSVIPFSRDTRFPPLM